MRSKIIYLFLLTLYLVNYVYAESWNSVNITGSYLSQIKATQLGLLVGEIDTRIKPNTYNGVYISKDFGHSWEKLGLETKGVTSLTECDENIYAGTYFTVNNLNGIYKYSKQSGWVHLNFNLPIASLSCNKNYLYAGTYDHGLWVSQDLGDSWEQKIGSGYFGPTILTINTNKKDILTTTQSNTWISSDNGVTWNNIPALANKYIKHIVMINNVYIVGTFTEDGIYISKDAGITWNKAHTFGQKSVGGISYYKDCIYAGKSDSSGYGISKSCDLGVSWESLGAVTNDASSRVNSIEIIHAVPDKLFVTINGYGAKRYDLPEADTTNPIFSRPWEDTSTLMTDLITSYFDHEYPLLGSNFAEPSEYKYTTLNYLGIRDKQPYIYYSSHNGTDFKLPLGTPILAVDKGLAKYTYCKDCGNTIVIEHDTGYETEYMHLQDSGLVTKGTPINVSKGQIIGNVGLTGNTSGPHLHFGVIADYNKNNTFSDDYPYGLTDPFGWEDENIADPWPNYILGSKSGTTSKYLWLEPAQILKQEIVATVNTTTNFNNYEIDINQNTLSSGATLQVNSYIRPNIESYLNLFYVPSSSILITLRNILGKNISEFVDSVKLSFDISKLDFTKVDVTTLKYYYLNENTNIWTPIESVLDSMEKTLYTYTNHFSKFAIFGNYKNKVNGWVKSVKIKNSVFST